MNLAVPNRESPKDTLSIARRWLDEFEQVALATVVSTWGSSPVPVGGQLVVGPNGQFEGSVSGGCVEVEVITEAADVLTRDRPKLLDVGVGEDVAWRAGLPCGGAISIYIEPLQRQRDAEYLDRILATRRARMSLVLASGERRLFEAPRPMPAEIARPVAKSTAAFLSPIAAAVSSVSRLPTVAAMTARIAIVTATRVRNGSPIRAACSACSKCSTGDSDMNQFLALKS
jgi:xanthine dehydrogenase accessory factor